MPLKHSTETFLVLLLALAIAVTGLVVAVLPPLSMSLWPWAIAFAMSVIYPIALSPLFRDRRADYAFRALHAIPAIMLLLWLALDLSGGWTGLIAQARSWFVWFGALPLVAVSFLLLWLFCLKVLRQRGPRTLLLLAVFLPFLLLGYLTERNDWSQTVAALVDRDSTSGTGAVAQASSRSRRASAGTVRGSSQSSKAPSLPSSGFGMEVLIPAMLAGYCAAVQRKSSCRAKVRA